MLSGMHRPLNKVSLRVSKSIDANSQHREHLTPHFNDSIRV